MRKRCRQRQRKPADDGDTIVNIRTSPQKLHQQHQQQRQQFSPATSSKIWATVLLSTICISATASWVSVVNGYAFQHGYHFLNGRSINHYNHCHRYYATTCQARPSQQQHSFNHRSGRTFLLSTSSSSSSSATTSTTSSREFSSGNHTLMHDSRPRAPANTETGRPTPSITSNPSNAELQNNDSRANGKTQEEESPSASSSSTQLPDWLQEQIEASQKQHLEGTLDIPRPTENGGHSHTAQSKAKISAANKGNTPWNKGRKRSEAERAKIAEGVRRRNRERFLQKLADMGMTEEQYEAQQAQEKAKKEADKKARKTDKGGYRPTQETKKKISKILKEKWASGEMKQRVPRDPAKVRRGFTHSAETRAKISASLRKRWADDEDYRAHMLAQTHANSANPDINNRISKTLRKKWQDPEFRTEMMRKMATREQSSVNSHREKISEAMKKRWQDEDYRKRATEAMRKKQAELAKSRPPPKKKKTNKTKPPKLSRPATVKQPRSDSHSRASSTISSLLNSKDDDDNENSGVRMAQPMVAPRKVKGAQKRKRTTTASSKTTASGSNKATTVPKQQKEKQVAPTKTSATTSASSKAVTPAKKKTKEAPGSKSRLREERRDLYDLLYGDEDDEDDDGDSFAVNEDFENKDDEDRGSVSIDDFKKSRNLASVFLEDEDLDAFDPYGLEDF